MRRVVGIVASGSYSLAALDVSHATDYRSSNARGCASWRRAIRITGDDRSITKG